jgi:hypothetical protein
MFYAAISYWLIRPPVLVQAKKMAVRAILMAGPPGTGKTDSLLLVNMLHTAISYWLIKPSLGAG